MRNQEPHSRPSLPSLTPIGLILTPFQQAADTPIQSAVAGGVLGEVEIFPEFSSGLCDIAGSERFWLIYLLDRASSPPYLDTQEHGIFATRSPARPNHIGLSSVRLWA